MILEHKYCDRCLISPRLRCSPWWCIALIQVDQSSRLLQATEERSCRHLCLRRCAFVHHLAQPGCLFLSYFSWWGPDDRCLWFNRTPPFDNDSEPFQILVLLPRQVQKTILSFRGVVERFDCCCEPWSLPLVSPFCSWSWTRSPYHPFSSPSLQQHSISSVTLFVQESLCAYTTSGNCNFWGSYHFRCS
jgi:hypothetical protein